MGFDPFFYKPISLRWVKFPPPQNEPTDLPFLTKFVEETLYTTKPDLPFSGVVTGTGIENRKCFGIFSHWKP
jgi:hypothetical protein